MDVVTRERVPLVTGLLSVISLALVFGAAGGAIPQDLVPSPPQWALDAIPAINAGLSLAAIVMIAIGWRAIRRRDVTRHRTAMIVSVILFAVFLTLYLYRLVVIGGASEFTGPDVIYQFVYLPVLAVHMLLAIVCIPLLYYVLLLAGTHSVDELSRTRHATVGRIAASLWLVSFALGIVVYALLHQIY